MKKRAAPSTPARPRGTKGVAGVSKDVKEYAAAIAVELQAFGLTVAQFTEASAKAGYAVNDKSLYRQMARVRAGQPVFSPEEKRGRPAVMEEEQWEIVCGFVLVAEEKVSLHRVWRFITEKLGVAIGRSTVQTQLVRMELTNQLVGLRARPVGVDAVEYATRYFDKAVELRLGFFIGADPALTYCMDSVTNSLRAERQHGYSGKGNRQKRLRAPTSSTPTTTCSRYPWTERRCCG